ncbi:hypothetical protein NDU88_002339 [Pleurodeles waltl]|uniref:Uncharacterized protein n=1 Tax=Pleurodeles waltl TaxID=8319 RepID=A0AAV7U9E7_PLEWA|nr:hypothetical protein NDU88_002339 [Pleurodeles waltl]
MTQKERFVTITEEHRHAVAETGYFGTPDVIFGLRWEPVDGHQAKNWIVAVRDEEGVAHNTWEAIVESLAKYYERLYTSSTVHTDEDCVDLLRDISLQVLSRDDRDDLEQDLMEKEVGNAIRELQSRKAAKPNGLPIELYKCVAKEAAKHVLNMFRDARKEETLPLHQRAATTVVIPKKGKRLEMCSSYQAHIPLKRGGQGLGEGFGKQIEKSNYNMIHPNQSGFMPHRGTRLSLRRLYGVMHMTGASRHVYAVLLSLCAWMAFNSIECSYLFAALA